MSQFWSDCATISVVGKEIIQGLIIGVGAGTVLGLYSEMMRLLSRRRQISFIREYIIRKFKKIAKAKTVEARVGGSPEVLGDYVRWVLFESFLMEFRVVLDNRTGSMSGAQLSDLYGRLAESENVRDMLRKIEKHPEGLGQYRSFYRGYSGFKWLKLPKELKELTDASQ